MTKSLIRFVSLASSAALAATMLGAGVASANSADISLTGPGSHNRISLNRHHNVRISNHNDIDLTNSNHQTARSGNAKVWGNTWGGDASTGDAWNDNSTTNDVSVTNGGGCCFSSGSSGHFDAAIDTTGPDSRNSINAGSHNSFNLSNRNDIDVTNRNNQTATSGNATVGHNTVGGDASTGNASNSNWTANSVDVSNNGGCGCDFGNDGSSGSASIHLTGPDSTNRIDTNRSNSVNISNRNDVDITNTNNQTARSGNANVWGNTIGGSASSGNASNSNSTSNSVSISN